MSLNTEAHRWWPIALADEAADGPVALTLLEQDLVLWRDQNGQAILLADQCPHRGARLSLGLIQQNSLQCPYHGWRFNAQGACIAIPAVPGFCPPASSAVRRYEVCEAHGLIWTRLASPTPPTEGSDQPQHTQGPPELPGLAPRRLIYGPFDVATSAPRAVENFLDTAHFAFVHAGWLGEAGQAQVPDHQVCYTDDGRPIVEDYRAWQPRASATSLVGSWVNYRYEVLSPFSALLTKKSQDPTLTQGGEDSYVIWANPSHPEACRLWFAQYTSDLTTSEAQLRAFQVAIFAQDQPVLESQRPKRLPLNGTESMSAADRLSAAYRRYLTTCQIRFGIC